MLVFTSNFSADLRNGKHRKVDEESAHYNDTKNNTNKGERPKHRNGIVERNAYISIQNAFKKTAKETYYHS